MPLQGDMRTAPTSEALAGLRRGLEAGAEGQPANLGPSRTEGASDVPGTCPWPLVVLFG
ncbi:hypothetical protein XAC3607_1530027 [Xanthomonas citri pv. citri]|nr:hypothetical protein XAC3615_6000006 [Xanthomonas citri pv. citri]CEH75216.1 hypothetical protein XAC3607_1530027 [Xanthomonas citri pv. citri]